MLFLELKLNTKEDTANERVHLFVLIKFITKILRKKAAKLQMSKNQKSNRRNNKKTFITIKLILEVYVYRQK